MADNVTLARSIYDAWNDRNFDVQADLMTPDSKMIVVGSGETYEGPEGSRRYNTLWASGFPDGAIRIDRVTASGDVVVVEYTGNGTHTGTLTSPMGDIPATGRSVTLQLCDVLEFGDGKLRTQRTYFDTGSLMAQLGITAGQATTP